MPAVSRLEGGHRERNSAVEAQVGAYGAIAAESGEYWRPMVLVSCRRRLWFIRSVIVW
jgi:hypothetical protein